MSSDDLDGYQETLTREEMSGVAGQRALQRCLGSDFHAMRARPEGRSYRVEGLDARSLAKLKATRLVGAYPSTLRIHPDAGEYSSLVGGWIGSNEQLVFVPIDEGLIRVYHFFE